MMETTTEKLAIQRPANVPQEVVEKAEEACLILQKAQSLTIETDGEFSKASELLVAVKTRSKSIEGDRVTITKPMNDALKAVNAYFSQPRVLYEKAESILKAGLVRYQTAKEMKAQAEQATLNEIARQEHLKNQAKLEKKAQIAEAKGNEENAMELRHVKDTVVPVAPVVEATTIKAPGQSFRTVWRWEVTNPEVIPRSFMVLDEKQINAIARSGIKGAMNIAGIRFSETKQVAVRTA